ncbi:hypothetical protein DVH24_029369 [Malus domestica]|uniref:arginine--tRNA ligase n=1 Tax=Malus domestica TaxID=3750 RepID=A0A498HSW0_MALDO|nr:hypothetical protein DVH24_029369 [Malus domestica]
MFGTHLNLIAPISPSFCRLSCHHPSPSLPATGETSSLSLSLLFLRMRALTIYTDLLKVASRELIFAAKSHSVSTMATEEENVGNAKQQLAKLFEVSLRRIVPDEQDVAPVIAASTGKFGDYQCNNAMGLWSKIKGKGSEFRGPPSVGQAIMKNLPDSEVIESCSVAGPGFVNVVLSKKWLAKRIQKMLIDGIEKWAPQLPIKRAVVDFSSPNIAKEMHVGHLRSTIIGDTLSRILEFSNVEVLRRNHVGDWGTQFGMLIEFLFEKFPIIEDVNESAIGDLQAFYKASKQRFDDDPAFKERAQRAVVSLQGGEPKYRNAWLKICEISRKEFHKVYERLGVHLEEKVCSNFAGYSYGRLLIFLYRLNEEKADWIIYVTDVGQQQHFNMFFEAAKRAGWLPTDGALKPKVAHVGFGLVLGEDGKRFRTRSSEVVRLVDLLDEAKDRSKKFLLNVAFYKASKQRFDDDPAFKERAQRAVVSLQGGEPKYRNAWLKICEIGRKEFHKVYERLGVHLEENGESFYNPYIPEVLKELSDKGLIEESQGARVIFLEGFNIPLIVVKSDGGFNYASTDLAALWYRLNEEKADWIIYVTDVGQQQHFNMFFEAAKCAGWLPTDGALKPKVAYVGFGLVLGEDGKRFRTRSSEVVRLVDLLDEAKDRSKKVLVERGWTEQELNQIAESVGYGAVRVCLVRGMGRNRVGRMRSVPRLVR